MNEHTVVLCDAPALDSSPPSLNEPDPRLHRTIQLALLTTTVFSSVRSADAQQADSVADPQAKPVTAMAPQKGADPPQPNAEQPTMPATAVAPQKGVELSQPNAEQRTGDGIGNTNHRGKHERNRSLALDENAGISLGDSFFGCSQHDFSDNHKFYYDPYRGWFEPIAWNFRGCRHETEFNRTEHPLLLRLKTLPGYLAQRNRLVHELLHGAGSPESLRQRMHRFLDSLQDDRERDPFWDAHQLLPTINPY